MKERLHTYARFYFEVHAPPCDDQSRPKWVIGFARQNSRVHLAVPGRNATSFGICSDGTALYNSEVVEYSPPLLRDRVVGVLIDLAAGSISLVNGAGVLLPPAFGLGCRVKSRQQRHAEAAVIRAAPLVPVLAIL